MQERTESGQSIIDFCKTRGISRNAYFYWQRKLRAAACELAEQSADAQELIPAGWAMCKTRTAEPAGKKLIIEIGVYRINVGSDTDLSLLKQVCRMLTSLC